MASGLFSLAARTGDARLATGARSGRGVVRVLDVLAGITAAVVLSGTTAAQELPAEVATPYLAYERALAEEDWQGAADAALQTAEAADAAGIDADLRLILWENSGLAHARTDNLLAAQDHLARSLLLATEVGSPTDQARLNYFLFSYALAGKGPDVALAHLAAFQSIDAPHTEALDAYEREMLFIVLTRLMRLNPFREDGITDEQWRWLNRLEAISHAGSEEYVLVRRIRVSDAIRRASWDEATNLIGEIFASPPQGSDAEEILNELTTQFNIVLVFGYGDRTGDGTDRLPAAARENWCAALTNEPVAVWQRIPAVNINRRPGETLRVEVHYTVDANGRMGEFRAEPADNRASSRAARILENAVEDWRWRPQCEPTADYSFAQSRVFNNATFMHGSNPYFAQRGNVSGRGRLFYSDASSLVNGWSRN